MMKKSRHMVRIVALFLLGAMLLAMLPGALGLVFR